jgi:hypothetical protein
MKSSSNHHSALQALIDCYLETNPSKTLNNWADSNWKLDPNVDTDESCLKYLALVLLDAIESRANKIVLEANCPVLVVSEDKEHMLPAAAESILARGLEILRDICGMEGPVSKGTLSLGIRNSSLELKIEKSEAVHIIHLPAF